MSLAVPVEKKKTAARVGRHAGSVRRLKGVGARLNDMARKPAIAPETGLPTGSSDTSFATPAPAPVVEKIVAGKMEKFYEEVCLLEQPFIKDQTINISQLIAAKVGKLGENIAVRRFARFKVGDATATVAFTSTKPDNPSDAGGDAPAPAAK